MEIDYGTQHAHLYFHVGYAPPERETEYKEIEQIFRANGAKGSGHLAAIKAWGSGDDLARAMFRINEIGRVLIGKNESALIRLLGTSANTDLLGRIPFSYTQNFRPLGAYPVMKQEKGAPLPSEGQYSPNALLIDPFPSDTDTTAFVPILEAFSDTFMWLCNKALDSGVEVPKRLRDLVRADSPTQLPDHRAIWYEPLAASIAGISELVALGKWPSIAELVLTLPDLPETVYLTPAEDGTFVMIETMFSPHSKVVLVRAMEQKIRRRVSLGTLTVGTAAGLVVLLQEGQDGHDWVSQYITTHESQSEFLDWVESESHDGGAVDISIPGITDLGAPRYVLPGSLPESTQSEKKASHSNSAPIVGAPEAVIVFYDPMTGAGQLKTPEGDPFDFRVECAGNPFKSGDPVTFVKDGDRATRVRRLLPVSSSTAPDDEPRTLGTITKLVPGSGHGFGFIEDLAGVKTFMPFTSAKQITPRLGLRVSYVSRLLAKGPQAFDVRECTSEELQQFPRMAGRTADSQTAESEESKSAARSPAPQDDESRVVGNVIKLFPDKQFGFVESLDGTKAFLHYSETQGVDLTVGLPVSYIIRSGAKGPKAHKIRLCTSDELLQFQKVA